VVVASEELPDAIDERTAVVSITAVCYRNGARLPVEEIAAVAREKGALTVLDAYQAAGTYPLDVTELGVDVVAAGVLKYLLASAGLAFMWVRPGLDLVPTQITAATSRRPRRGASRRERRPCPRSTAASPAWS
jgi:selenocysteine lyase/cysteine desulfurase